MAYQAWHDDAPEHYPYPGQHFAGLHIYENCMYCFQRLVASNDPGINYCPNCGKYQWHRV